MHVEDLIQLLEESLSKHGNTYISIRHTAKHEFAPDDDLTDISAKYDESTNLFIISIEN